jgi:hypothetical protein
MHIIMNIYTIWWTVNTRLYSGEGADPLPQSNILLQGDNMFTLEAEILRATTISVNSKQTLKIVPTKASCALSVNNIFSQRPRFQ